MFRAFVFVESSRFVRPIRVTGQHVGTWEEADGVHDYLRAALAGATGGGIEQHVPGVGWVVADQEPVASV